MASMSINLSPKPLKPSQFHYFTPKIRAPISLHPTKFQKIRPPISLNPTKFQIRAPNLTNFQIKASSDNNRNRSVDALNSGGTKRTFNLNESQKALLGSPNLNEFQKLLLILGARTNGFLKMGAVFLVKLSFGMSLAASSVVVVPLLTLETIFKVIIFGNEEIKRIYAVHALCILFSGAPFKYVFPVVFGDGDPNQGIEEKMWKMIEHYITLNDGVVAAEELAPYLDPNTTKNMEDDSYILPVLLRLGGQPEVDDESTAPQSSEGKEHVGRWDDRVELEKFLKEKEWKFSDFDDLDVKVNGGVNVILGRTLFWHLSIGLICWLKAIPMPSNPFLRNIYYPLILMHMIYASSFLVIKFFRRVVMDYRNLKIAERNKAREELVKGLESPNRSLKQKILSARSMALRKSTGEDRIGPHKDISYEEWDRIFNARWN